MERAGGPSDAVPRLAGPPGQPSRLTPLAALVQLAFILLLGLAFPGEPHGLSTLTTTLFLCIATAFFSFYLVPIRFGALRLVMIGAQASALLLPPAEAELVGLVAGLTRLRHRPKGARYFGVAAPVLWTGAGAAARIALQQSTHVAILAILAVPLVMTALNWTLTGLEFRLITGEPIRLVLRRNFDLSWAYAFGYFALCSMLIAGVIDGTLRGYALASLAAYLSITLTVSLSERSVRLSLEAHVRDGERYVAYVRATEGLIHRLRNECAITKGLLEEILESPLSSEGHRHATIAKDAMGSALEALNRIGTAITMGTSKDLRVIDAQEVLRAAVNVIRPFARQRKVEIREHRGLRPLWVLGDAHLLRDVLENLLLNAVQAAPELGRVDTEVQERKDWIELRVTDNGPGIPEGMRERLFEPHLTTKPTGNGMGLFTSYGVVREHRGKLLYEGSPDGAVFVVLLPPAAGLSEAGVSAEQGTVVGQPSLASTKR